MARIALIGLAALLLAGRAQAQSLPAQSLPAQSLPVVDHVVVNKTDRTIALYAHGTLVRTIAGIQLGDAPTGPKRFQGDERTPEGRYAIDYANPQSAYTLSLHISYPDAADQDFAKARGHSPGGAIFIHGQPNGMATRMRGDWTDGCIAVSNDEIEYLWQTVPDGTTIDILP